MQSTYVTPVKLRVAQEVLQWCTDFLIPEHPQMKRPIGGQAVCPFVQSAIDADTLYMTLHADIRGADESRIEELVLSYIDAFKNMGPFIEGDDIKKALLLVFPNLPDRETRVLDIVHDRVKNTFVEHGLMIGQFHRSCKETSVHNPAFRVSTSPHPLMAIRHMAIHDILFLGERKEWFHEYNLRFGERFRRLEDIEDYNRHLIGLYARAKERWQK